jgi:signal transduction histidine kinase
VDLTEEGSSPLVRGDSSQLLHVFLQIVANAVDASEPSKYSSAHRQRK